MRSRSWPLLVATLIGAISAVAIAAPPASAEDPPPCSVCGELGDDSVYTGMDAKTTASQPDHVDKDVVEGGKKVHKRVPLVYSVPLNCPGNGPEDGDGGNACAPAVTGCQYVPNASGPYVKIYRHPADETAPVNWEYVGTTCYTSLLPGGAGRPQLTMAMIVKEWKQTPFAKPGLSIQPVNNRTLVTLPTYFSLVWPQTGYQPGEVRATTLLGHRVEIRPTFKSNNFSYGDGTASGPTPSFGGAYPSGDVTHAYDDPGTFTVGVSTTYGGQFRVDGGDWADIPGTATIAGPTQAVQVLTSTNRLVR